MNNTNIINTDNAIEVYIFYSSLSNFELKGDFRHFFKTLDSVNSDMSNCIVFLTLKSAMQYSCHIHQPHVTLKAYVSRDAIKGHAEGLTLKKGFLHKDKIEGCYTGGINKGLYLHNPSFKIKYYLTNFELAAN